MQTAEGNVLNVAKGVIVHGCNAQGVMGSGIALEVKNRFPEVFAAYHKKYVEQGGMLNVGDIIPVQVADDKWIVNAITQEWFGREKGIRYVSYDGIANAFEQISKSPILQPALKHGLFFPLIGAGLAQGKWNIISNIIEHSTNVLIEKTLYIFKP